MFLIGFSLGQLATDSGVEYIVSHWLLTRPAGNRLWCWDAERTVFLIGFSLIGPSKYYFRACTEGFRHGLLIRSNPRQKVYGEMHLKDLLGSFVRVGYRIPVPYFYLVLHGLRCRKSTIMDQTKQKVVAHCTLWYFIFIFSVCGRTFHCSSTIKGHLDDCYNQTQFWYDPNGQKGP